MATRAERFRAQVQRSGPKRPKKPKPRRRSYAVDTSQPRVSASDRKHGGPSTGLRNLSRGRRATYALEDSAAPSPPSRKSTRRSKNRQKAATPMKARVDREVVSPARRHMARK